MKIVGPDNYYLEEVKGTFSDAEKLFECFIHWPVETKDLTSCLGYCSESVINWNDTIALQSPLPDINKALMFMKNPQDEVVGVFQFVFYQRLDSDGPNAFNLERALILPQFRGQGNFTRMSRLVIYLGYHWMFAEECNITTISTAPQIKHKLDEVSGNPRVIRIKDIEGRWTEEESSLDYDSFNPVGAGIDWQGFQFLVDGVVVPPPISSRNPDTGSP